MRSKSRIRVRKLTPNKWQCEQQQRSNRKKVPRMGQQATKYLLPHYWREDEPDTFAPIKYHPQFGFDGERPKRELPVSELEMDSAGLEIQARDHCAHLQIQYRGCISYHRPFWYHCKGLLAELDHCYMDELTHDMKEFERERRLNARERRISGSS